MLNQENQKLLDMLQFYHFISRYYSQKHCLHLATVQSYRVAERLCGSKEMLENTIFQIQCDLKSE